MTRLRLLAVFAAGWAAGARDVRALAFALIAAAAIELAGVQYRAQARAWLRQREQFPSACVDPAAGRVRESLVGAPGRSLDERARRLP